MNKNIASHTTHLDTYKNLTNACTHQSSKEEQCIGFTCYLHFLVVVYPHPWPSMHHLLAALCALTLFAMLTAGITLAQPFHSPQGIGPQDHLFPMYDVSNQQYEVRFYFNM